MIQQIFARMVSIFWLPVLTTVLLPAGFTMSVLAADSSANTPTVASSGSKLGPGDSKKLYVCMPGFELKKGEFYYAPKDSRLWIATHEDKEGKVLVYFTKIGEDDPECAKAFLPQTKVQKNIEYTMSAANLDNYASITSGPEYGLLVVPFKFHPSDHSLSGAATVGGYLGWKVTRLGVDISPVVAAGMGVVQVTKQENGKSTTSNAASFSAAGGLIISLTKAGLFQAGFLGGVDWAGKGNAYKYEGKPWFAISFGTNLSQ